MPLLEKYLLEIDNILVVAETNILIRNFSKMLLCKWSGGSPPRIKLSHIKYFITLELYIFLFGIANFGKKPQVHLIIIREWPNYNIYITMYDIKV